LAFDSSRIPPVCKVSKHVGSLGSHPFLEVGGWLANGDGEFGLMASADDVRKRRRSEKKRGRRLTRLCCGENKKQRNRRDEQGKKKGMTVLQLRCIVDCSFVRAWGLKPVTDGMVLPKRAGLSRLGTNQAADS